MTLSSIAFTGLKRQYANLRSEILDATDRVLSSGQLMDGEYRQQFEQWLAQKNRSRYAITCHSGTQALEIIAHYLAIHWDLPEAPCALVPAMTYVATANAFARAGWNVHVVDTDYYGIIDVNHVPKGLKWHVVVLVGLYGAALDVKRWTWFNEEQHCIIEDGAQHWLSDRCRRIGEATAISFDPMKNLNCYGNGGAVVTDNRILWEFAQSWCNNGKPIHDMTGTNSRLSEVDCAGLLIKSRHLTEWQLRRKKIAKHWMEHLQAAGIRTLIDQRNFTKHSYHKFVIEVDNRDRLQQRLESRGIETRVHYAKPLHELGGNYLSGPGLLSTSSAMSRRVLSLPLYPELTDSEVEYIAQSVIAEYN